VGNRRHAAQVFGVVDASSEAAASFHWRASMRYCSRRRGSTVNLAARVQSLAWCSYNFFSAISLSFSLPTSYLDTPTHVKPPARTRSIAGTLAGSIGAGNALSSRVVPHEFTVGSLDFRCGEVRGVTSGT
jgi:hypothetical protein